MARSSVFSSAHAAAGASNNPSGVRGVLHVDPDRPGIRGRSADRDQSAGYRSSALLSTPSGTGMDSEGSPPLGMLRYIASQIEVTTNNFETYADRDETRREHLADLLVELGLRTLGGGDYSWPKDTGLGRRKLRPLGVSPQVVPIPTSP